MPLYGKYEKKLGISEGDKEILIFNELIEEN